MFTSVSGSAPGTLQRALRQPRTLLALTLVAGVSACGDDGALGLSGPKGPCDNNINVAEPVDAGFSSFAVTNFVQRSLFGDTLAGLEPDTNDAANTTEIQTMARDLAVLLRTATGATGDATFAPLTFRNPLELLLQQVYDAQIDNFLRGRAQVETCVAAGIPTRYNNTNILFSENIGDTTATQWGFTFDIVYIPNNDQITETVLGRNTNTLAQLTFKPAAPYEALGYTAPTAALISLGAGSSTPEDRTVELIKQWPERKDTLTISGDTPFALGAQTDLRCARASIDYALQRVTVHASTTATGCGDTAQSPLVEYSARLVSARS